MTTGRLAGRIGFITGAARGQGSREAERFLAEGAAGVVLADVLRTDLDATVAALAGRYGQDRVLGVVLDVRSSAEWAAAVAATEARFGGLHVLVNNAGIIGSDAKSDLADMDEGVWERVLAVNLTGPFLGIRATAALMRQTVRADVAADPRQSGSIVNISSAQAYRPSAGNGAYASSKWGLRGLTRAAALELAPDIRVNAVMPGPIDTPMIGDALAADTGVLAQLVADVPLGRVGTTAEVADLVVFLASPESSYCTGADFLVEGGRVAGPARPG